MVPADDVVAGALKMCRSSVIRSAWPYIRAGALLLIVTINASLSGEAVAGEEAVVLIKVEKPDGTLRSRGSGILLNAQGHILTARHVVESRGEFDKIKVALKSGDRPPVPIAGLPICMDKPAGRPIDLCLLKILDQEVRAENVSQFYPLSCRPLRTTEQVIGAGYAGDDRQVSFVPGPITSGINEDYTHPTSVGLLPGMSGGPVLDAGGNIVGVVSAGGKIPLVDNMAVATVRTFVIPLSYAIELLNYAAALCPIGLPPDPAAASSSIEDVRRSNAARDNAAWRAGESERRYYDLAARLQRLEADQQSTRRFDTAGAERALASGDLDSAEQDIKAIETDVNSERVGARQQISVLLAALEKSGFAAAGVIDSKKQWKGADRRIEVCFLNGESKAHRFVALVARRWMLFANVEFDFGRPGRPRTCTERQTPIRIDTESNSFWSYVGTDARKVSTGAPTMGLALKNLKKESEVAAYILHEFGHLLGLEHIYNHKDGCDFNWDRLYSHFQRMGMSRADVDGTFRPVTASNSIGSLDASSIMSWHLPPDVYASGVDSRCYARAPPRDLALSDKLVAFRSYP